MDIANSLGTVRSAFSSEIQMRHKWKIVFRDQARRKRGKAKDLKTFSSLSTQLLLSLEISCTLAFDFANLLRQWSFQFHRDWQGGADTGAHSGGLAPHHCESLRAEHPGPCATGSSQSPLEKKVKIEERVFKKKKSQIQGYIWIIDPVSDNALSTACYKHGPM